MANTKGSALPSRGTPDRANDGIYVFNGGTGYQSTVNNELGISGAPVGTTDSQTLTNKTLNSASLNSPVLNGVITGTYTLGGSATFPASVATLTGVQTLTNKTLTSPTINSPTITNASITADAITGFTTSNTGTIYGVPVTTGAIAGSSIATGTVGAAQLSTSAIKLGYSSTTTPQSGISTEVDITSLAVTVTVPTGGRDIKISGTVSYSSATSGALFSLRVKESTTILKSMQVGVYNTSNAFTIPYICRVAAPSAGSHTYKLTAAFSAGTGQVYGDTPTGFINDILVEAI